MRYLVLIIFFVSTYGAVAGVCQSSVSNTSQLDHDGKLDQYVTLKAKEYDIWKTKLLQDPERIERLRKDAESTDKHFGGQAEIAQETLARLGDRNEMDGIVCDIYAKDPEIQRQTLRRLEDVGGYASIAVLAKIMYEDPPYNSSPSGQSVTLRQSATTALVKLVPELPAPIIVRMGVIPPSDQQARDLYNWIAERRPVLGRLGPTEGGDVIPTVCAQRQRIDFSPQDITAIQILTTLNSAEAPGTRFTVERRQGKFFLGKRPVNQAAVTALIDAVRSPQEDVPSLSDLHLDASWLAANADQALKDVMGSTTQDIKGRTKTLDAEEQKQFLVAFSDVKRMNDTFRGCVVYRCVPTADEPRVQIAITLLHSRKIKLWSEGSGLFLLPWKIEGQEHRKLFDYRLSLAVAALFPKGAPNVDRLSATDDYTIRRQLALSLTNWIASDCFKGKCPSRTD